LQNQVQHGEDTGNQEAIISSSYHIKKDQAKEETDFLEVKRASQESQAESRSSVSNMTFQINAIPRFHKNILASGALRPK